MRDTAISLKFPPDLPLNFHADSPFTYNPDFPWIPLQHVSAIPGDSMQNLHDFAHWYMYISKDRTTLLLLRYTNILTIIIEPGAA